MTKTISSNDAKQRWGSMIADVADHGEEVIVESHGKPRVVVISVSAYEEVQAYRKEKRRAEALARFDRLSARIAERNKDQTETEEEIIEWSVQLSRELIDSMAERGVITFERDLHKK